MINAYVMLLKTFRRSLLTACSAVLLLSADAGRVARPLPEFTYQGVSLDPNDLSYAPNRDFEHPTVIKVEGRVPHPLGRYYLYYAPHKHIGVGLVYSDSLAGPWKEYGRV